MKQNKNIKQKQEATILIGRPPIQLAAASHVFQVSHGREIKKKYLTSV